jgi:choline dehydrogenase-like flavoprotein
MTIKKTQYRPSEEIKTTVCVVGSGPAGAFVAVELAKNEIDVLVLEAGTHEVDSSTDEMLDQVVVSGHADLNFGFSRQFGGSSNLWSGRVASLEPIDIAKRDWIPFSGWPFGYSELHRYYAQVLEIMDIPYSELLDIKQNRSKEFFPIFDQNIYHGLDIKRFCWNDPPFNTGSYLRENSSGHGNRLRYCMGAKVRRLYQTHDGRLITHVEMILPDGNTMFVSAKIFVIAAGGLETPRILFNSDSVYFEGIGNRHGVLGKYLQTHPKADMGILVLNHKILTNSPLFSDQSRNGYRVRFGLGLNPDTQKKLESLNHYVQLSPLLEYQTTRLFEAFKGSSALKLPFINRSRFLRGGLPRLGLIVFEAIGRIARLQQRARMFVLRGFLDQFPDPANHVSRSQRLDSHGDPMIDINWSFSSRDKKTVVSFFNHLDSVFRTHRLGHIETNIANMEEWPLTAIHSHFIGTTRMGEISTHAVVDPDCRVFGTNNLYISGPSTWPTGGYANPFLTIAALSLRLGSHLLSRLQPINILSENSS